MTIKSKSADTATDLKNHGIAVHGSSTLSMKPWRDPASGRDYVYLGLICRPSLVVQVDVERGTSRQFDLPKGAHGPWGMAFTLEGHILVTSVDGQLVRIDPKSAKSWTVARTGQWLWYVCPGPDGKFYLASSPNAALFQYDPFTDKTVEVARFSHIDKYLRIVFGGQDGYIYGSIGCEKTQAVAYHIASGKTRILLPASEVGPDFIHMGYGADGKIYVKTVKNNVYRIEHGEAFAVDQNQPDTASHTAALNRFARLALPDGRSLAPLDPDAIRVGDGPDARIIKYRYKNEGVSIFHLAEGPDKNVYASTIMPLYMIRYDPATKKLQNLGRGGPDNGEAYSISHTGGKLYYATYSTGKLMSYDPSRPLHSDAPGAYQWLDNPRLIGNLGVGHCRPRAMCIDNRQRVWIGSHAEYGKRHGGLAYYDPTTDKLQNNPLVIADQSIQSLTGHTSDDIVFGGTDTCRGTGMSPNTKEAHLFAWDSRNQKLIWKVKVKGQTGIINLLYRDGKLYGTSRPTFSFFCFDVATRKMDYFNESQIDACREQSMTFGPDGNIYGITYLHLFRWRPKTGQIEPLFSTTPKEAAGHDDGSLFHRGAVINGDRFYFSCATKVMSLKLPKFEA